MKISKLVVVLSLCLFSIQTTLAQVNPKSEEYMQVLVVYKGFKTTIFTISAAGEIEEQKTNSVSDGFAVKPDKVANVQLEIQALLNEYAKNGWLLRTVSNLSGEGIITSSYYLAKALDE